MYAVFCFCVLYTEMGKVMNMHKAKQYTQVTCLTCLAAVNNCTRLMFSPSLLFSGTRE